MRWFLCGFNFYLLLYCTDNLPYTFYEKTADGTVKDITDEQPFDVPENWEWVRLGTICTHNTGKTLDKGRNTGILREYITTSNLYWGRFELDNLRLMAIRDSELEKCTAIKGDLLICEGGDAGRSAVWENDTPICIQNHIHRVRLFANICPYYIFYNMMLVVLGGSIANYKKGIGIQGLSSASLANILLPLPPLVEQHRIVERIEQLLPHITAYDVAEQKLTVLNATFPYQLKKSILQSAVQGKLVPQDENDEPASVLLERIRAEREQFTREGKIKRDKFESVIIKRDNSHYEKQGGIERCIDDEIPFDVPDNWAWARLGTLCNFGDCVNTESDEIALDAWLLDLEDIEKDSGRLLQRKRKSEVKSLSTKHRFSAGQVLYSKLRPYLNKVIIADEDGYCTSEILPLDFGKYVLNNYAQIYLMSPFFVGYATQSSYGVKMPRLGTQDGKNALVPLPPYNEQKRIAMQMAAVLPFFNSL